MPPWVVPNDIGLWDIPTFWLLLAILGFKESTLLNLSAETLLVAAFAACAQAVQKRMKSRPNPILSTLQGIGLWLIRLFPILPIAVGHYLEYTERWAFLVPVASLVAALTALAEWPDGRGSLRMFINELFLALLETMFWGFVRQLATMLLVPDWFRQSLLFSAAVLLPFDGSQWRIYAILLCGAYQAFDVQQSLNEASNSSITRKISNQTNPLVRRFDNTAPNPYLPPIVGAFVGAFIGAAFAVLLWYVGPRNRGGNDPNAHGHVPPAQGADPLPEPQQDAGPDNADEAGHRFNQPIDLQERGEWEAEGDLGTRHGEEEHNVPEALAV